MLVNILIGLIASVSAFAAPVSSSNTTDLIAKLKAADSAVQRNQILAQDGGNSSFVFNFTSPPSTAVVSSSAGQLVQANGLTFPALTDVDAALAVVTVEPCGLILPHLHPRGDEFVLVLAGEFFTQFIAESGAVLVSNTLEAFDATIFPKGAIHLEFNPTCEPAQFAAYFNTNDPGVSFVAANLFSLEDQLVIATLGGDAVVSGADLASIQQALPPKLATGVQECVSKCGITPYGKRSLAEVFGQ